MNFNKNEAWSFPKSNRFNKFTSDTPGSIYVDFIKKNPPKWT